MKLKESQLSMVLLLTTFLARLMLMVDLSISMMSVLLWMGSGVAVETILDLHALLHNLLTKSVLIGRVLLDIHVQCLFCFALLSLVIHLLLRAQPRIAVQPLYGLPPGCSVLS